MTLPTKPKVPGSNPDKGIYLCIDHKYFVSEYSSISVHLSNDNNNIVPIT